MGNKYTAFCVNEDGKKEKVEIMANNKVEVREIVLKNHPKYDVRSVLSEEEIKAIQFT